MLGASPYVSARFFLIIIITILIFCCIYVEAQDHNLNYNLSEEFLSLYEEIVELAKKGIDVSYMVNNLSTILEVIEQEQGNGKPYVDELLRFIRNAVDELKKDVPRITLYRDIVKLFIVVFLAFMPIIFYIFFPRLYLYAWFITRRRWVVKNESTR